MRRPTSAPAPPGSGSIAAAPQRLTAMNVRIPALEAEQTPGHLGPGAVIASFRVRSEQCSHAARVEEAVFCQARRSEMVPRPHLHLSHQQAMQRHPEAALRPFEQRPRHAPIEHLAQRRLGDAPVPDDRTGERQPEADHAVIENRDPRFECDGHARAIDLHENVIDHVRAGVGRHRPAQRIVDPGRGKAGRNVVVSDVFGTHEARNGFVRVRS